MTDAVWKPPVQITGTVTACLIARASGSFSPSILSAGTPASSHCLPEQLPGHACSWNSSRLRIVCVPLDGELLVGVGQHVDGQIGARRVLRMRKRAAGRDVNRVDAGIDQPLAHLDRLLDGVARLLELQTSSALLWSIGADLHLQVEVAADLAPGSP